VRSGDPGGLGTFQHFLRRSAYTVTPMHKQMTSDDEDDEEDDEDENEEDEVSRPPHRSH